MSTSNVVSTKKTRNRPVRTDAVLEALGFDGGMHGALEHLSSDLVLLSKAIGNSPGCAQAAMRLGLRAKILATCARSGAKVAS